MRNFFKKLSFTVIPAFALILASTSSFAGVEQKFAGTWHNQYGSEMRITVDPDGKVSGKYHSAVGRKEVTLNTSWFDLAGFVNGDVVSFVVSWGPSSGAISAWSGHYAIENDKNAAPQIKTLTHTSLPFSDANHWQRTVAGSDTFIPGPAK